MSVFNLLCFGMTARLGGLYSQIKPIRIDTGYGKCKLSIGLNIGIYPESITAFTLERFKELRRE